jgi:hypothetical protein
MANERALGISFIYAVQTWQQAAVAEPARDCGRILTGNRFAQSVCDSMPGFDSLEPPGKMNRLRSATGWT